MSREIDDLVAQHVMGWTPGKMPRGTEAWNCGKDGGWLPKSEFQPSSDISYAWWVRTRMQELGWISHDDLTYMGWCDKLEHPWGYSIWFQRWFNREEIKVRNATDECFHAHVKDFADAPGATCLAALEAVGVKIPEATK